MRKLTASLCLLLLLVGCGAEGAKSEKATTQAASASSESVSTEAVQLLKLTPEEGKAKIDQGGVVIVDVRTAEEYAGGHLPEALLLPLDGLEATAPESLPDKGATIILYCRSGNRSNTAGQLLIRMGYTAVYDLGGISDWPYDIESDQ